MNENGVIPDGPTPTPPVPLRRRLWLHRRMIAAAVGLALGLVCPLLPLQLRAPCAAVASVARTWTIGGNELP